MTYTDIFDVCNYIIEHDDVSELKLQKLLYFVQAYFLATTGEPCFDDDFEAWGNGPMIPEVHKVYGMFGSTDIPTSDNSGSEFINPEDGEKIDAVINHFKDYAGSDLTTLAVWQSPWMDNYVKGQQKIIPKEAIQDYFTQIEPEP